MVSNTAGYAFSDWENEIQLAQDAHIDAFALNIANGEDTTSTSMPNAFTAAENLKFYLFFSDAYYLHGKSPLVSTFEGPDNADDWVDLKSQMSLFFVPDWSSVGAKPASALGDGVADGLFSWAAWPNGPNDMDTYVDASYMQYLEEKPYMMPISPWFFTNMPGYDHSGWRQFLPYLIDLYKFNSTTSGTEGLVTGYRLNAAGACADSGTTANTASQLQLEHWPKDVVQDKIFYSALLSQPGEISVTIDGVNVGATWTNTPSGNVGIYHRSVSFAGHSRDVILSVSTSSGLIEVGGAEISDGCDMGDEVENWNAWVGYTMGNSPSGSSPDLNKEDIVQLGLSPFTPDTCVGGSGEDELAGLCSFGCNYGYCPIYNCTCTATGPLNTPPAQNTSIVGWAPDTDDNGLCNFACTRDYCPSPVCLDSTPDDDSCGSVDDDSDECSSTSPCDFSITYSSLDDLQADLDNLDPYCVDFYMLSALYGELETALNNYTNISDTTNYDDDFKEYSKYMKAQVQPQLTYFMNISEVIGEPNGLGNQYFECTSSIPYGTFDKNGSTTACPDEYVGSEEQEHIIFYDIVDQAGFLGNLTADSGVEPDWVTLDGGLFLGANTVPYYGTRPDCDLTWSAGYKCSWWQGYPVPAQDITITDPRDVMEKALPNIPNLELSISLTQLSIASGGFSGVIDDVVQSIATAVFTLISSLGLARLTS
ncbi:Glycoside hydrolase family 71 [Penicillium odoratum]|uniref:Glycoside hydrolase family 71 n=1 Tax=Penicillium odoratum TaxID=1167516 RepID=UPI002547C72C|nr:Glycoside hydrolase family 71 [Penicillium odoratum]KAJ5771869.1 Glycoside hydrolase family 71 [Penicillium odoratum]